MKIRMNKLNFGVLLGLYSLSLLTAAATESFAAEDQIIIEDLTSPQLRSEIKKIEIEFYRVFNSSTDDKDLTIVCYDNEPTDTKIKREICEPQFVVTKRADNASDSRFGIAVLMTPQALRRALTGEYAGLTTAITNLTKENEYFRELSSILGALQEELENR